jgi:hypothetical protein
MAPNLGSMIKIMALYLMKPTTHIKLKARKAKRMKCIGIFIPKPGKPLPSDQAIWSGLQGKAPDFTSLSHHTLLEKP